MNIRRNYKGFTLIELMIVVVIVGVLAAMALGRYLTAATRVKQAEAKGILKQLYALERAYFQEYGTYWPSDGSTITADSTGGNRGNFSMLSIQIEIMDGARYSYALAGGATTFTLTATADGLDDDGVQDIWRIDNTGVIRCLSDDSQD
ncbi:MAG: prepilin-type N-terminal cleavage/methylation domain-containing protein [candidate division Zixibacteria bacterium]|nr:prepilin-type N-terminal cleavage/methylation domain-containing protein [candidate division Zixibacteria bacterium]